MKIKVSLTIYFRIIVKEKTKKIWQKNNLRKVSKKINKTENE